MEKLVFLELPKGLLACACGKVTGLAQNQEEVRRTLGYGLSSFMSFPGTVRPYCTACQQHCREVQSGILTLLILQDDPAITASDWKKLSDERKQVSEAFSYVKEVARRAQKSLASPLRTRSFRRIICAEDNTLVEEE